MLSQRLLTRRLPQVAARYAVPRALFSQARMVKAAENDDPHLVIELSAINFPEPQLKLTLFCASLQNNNYPNPPAVKRQLRDPYGDWWDKQERRNFGEPVHEDNEILGVFSPEQYTHAPPGKAFFHLGCFVAAFLGLCGVVKMTYADKPAAARTFPDGLEKELGGASAMPVRLARPWLFRVRFVHVADKTTQARKPGQEKW